MPILGISNAQGQTPCIEIHELLTKPLGCCSKLSGVVYMLKRLLVDVQ